MGVCIAARGEGVRMGVLVLGPGVKVVMGWMSMSTMARVERDGCL